MRAVSKTRSSLPRSGIRELMGRSMNIPGAIHLEVGEPSVDTPKHICDAATQAMADGYTHYTPNAGLPSLKEKLADHVNKTYQLDVQTDQIVVTTGAINALSSCILALVDAGEEVLIPDPGFPNYEQIILSQNAIPVRYVLDAENGFMPSLKDLQKAVTENTKAILINSPGNPTGGVFSEAKLKEIIRFAKEHDLYVISDEVYDSIVFEGKHHAPLAYDDDDRVIGVYSFSKTYAMTGWRVGYAVAPIHVAKVMAKVQEPTISCTSSISQKAAETAITGPQNFLDEMCATYKKRRDQLFSLFEREGIKAYYPKGAFYMMVDVSKVELPTDEIAFTLLDEEHVAVAPGATFGESCEKMIRISFAAGSGDLLEGARRICRFIKKYQG